MKQNYSLIKVILGTYVCAMFAASIFLPVFFNNISEEGKFGLYFLQDTSAIWVTGLLAYYFGSVFLKFYLSKFSGKGESDKSI